jgi:hypothetical protein
MMKKILLLIFIIFGFLSTNAQTPLPIYSPSFGNAAGWQINGNATIISSTYLRLTPNAGNQAGSAFWKQKVSLPADFSFATYFVSRITPGSRADGMTFCIQQATNTAGSSGGGLGYQGIPGKSIGIEYDTYNNGEVGTNNHIALDINGVLHGTTNVVASPVNLADGANKYNWIEYNGSTQILEVRISNTNIRPTSPTLSVSINLAINFLNNSDVYFGFTAATGGATEEHAVYSALVAPNSSPITNPSNYTQGVASITLSSSNVISCSSLTSTITVTTKDINGVGMATNVNLTFDVGGGNLSQTTLTTNSSGIGTITFTSNANTLTSNTIRAEEPVVGAYGTVIVTKSGIVPVGGSVSSNIHTSITNTGTLTLTGYNGTIVKWQKSIDNGNTWVDITSTSTTYTYTNQTDGTLYRVVVSGGACTAYSTPGSVTVQFSYSGFVYNSQNIGIGGIPVNLYYKPKNQTVYTLYSTYLTTGLGNYSILTNLSSSANDFRITIENLITTSPLHTDAYSFNSKIHNQSFNAIDYYKMDVNNDNNITVTDIYLIYFRSNGMTTSWLNSTPNYRIFNPAEWSVINTSNLNLKSIYPGTQSVIIDGTLAGGSANFYLIQTGKTN